MKTYGVSPMSFVPPSRLGADRRGRHGARRRGARPAPEAMEERRLLSGATLTITAGPSAGGTGTAGPSAGSALVQEVSQVLTDLDHYLDPAFPHGPSLAERLARELADLVGPSPGDTPAQLAAKFVGIVLSPPILGPAALGAHLGDELVDIARFVRGDTSPDNPYVAIFELAAQVNNMRLNPVPAWSSPSPAAPPAPAPTPAPVQLPPITLAPTPVQLSPITLTPTPAPTTFMLPPIKLVASHLRSVTAQRHEFAAAHPVHAPAAHPAPVAHPHGPAVRHLGHSSAHHISHVAPSRGGVVRTTMPIRPVGR